MDSIVEILIWALITVVTFYLCNTYLGIRTAASLFLSLLVSSIIVYAVYASLFSEIAFMFTLFVGLIYALFRGIRDYRDPFDTSRDRKEPPGVSRGNEGVSSVSSKATQA